MYSVKAIIASFVLSTLVHAITVKEPDMFTVWQSGTPSQSISWQAVSSDPTDFEVQLVNQQGFLTSGPVTLTSSQQAGASDQTNTATVTYPNGAWPIGHGFQINLMSTSMNNNAILAQSSQFNITSGGSSMAMATSSSSGTPPMTLTNNAAAAMSSTTGTMSTALYTGNAVSASASGSASGIIPNAVSSKGSANTQFGKPGPIISIVISAAAFFGIFI